MNNLQMSITFFIILLISCHNNDHKYQKQIDVAKKLLLSFSKNDTSTVKNMMGAPLEEIGTDSELLSWEVKKAYNLIRQFGMPSEDKFILKEYSKKNPELLDIMVPLVKNGKGKLKDASITIAFVKYLPLDKIIDFNIQTTYEPKPTKAPDTLQINK